MSAKTPLPVGAEAIELKGWFKAHKFLLLRRASQLSLLGLFLIGPWFGIWWVKGNLAASMTLDFLPLADPLMLIQSLLARHWPEMTALVGAAIVALTYALVGGRVYCSWVCPINIVTDSAHWLHHKLGLPKGWQPKPNTRYYMLAAILIVSAASGTLAFELVNPITMLHRGLVFGLGFAWAFVIGLFLFDLLMARRGWCGHLCPVGAFYGLLGAKAVLRVSASQRAACDDCMDCFAVCPEMHVITPALRGKSEDTPIILSRDCTNCGRCIDICSVNVFQFTHRFDKRPSPGRIKEKSKLAHKATEAA